MAQNSPFAPSAIAALIAFGVLSFLGASYFTLIDPQPTVAGSHVFSRSAVGHRAFAELLRLQGMPVVVSRSNSARKSGDESLLIIAEPYTPLTLADIGPVTLLVLPKRTAEADPDREDWVRRAIPGDRAAVAEGIRQIVPDAAIVRGPADSGWIGPSRGTIRRWNQDTVPDGELAERIVSRAAPAIGTPQLIRSRSVTPIVSVPEGILFGATEIDGKTLFILSDPDLMANAGIGRDDNAALMLDLVTLARPAGGAVVFDEVVHGFQQAPNLWRAMFEPPFIAITAIAFAALAVLIWAASGRFGAPVPPPRDRSTAETDLIENAVGLLHQAGHAREIARHYPEVVLRNLSQRLHAPQHLSPDDRTDWIDRIGAARRPDMSFRVLAGNVEAASTANAPRDTRLMRSIQRLFDWKQELIDGPERHQDD